ncbi:MAG: glycosyltransferase family 2 protein, partial [Patescibacteria group bacterium]
MKKVDLSFVIPVKNEEKSVIQLALEIAFVCKEIRKRYEIIFVDDGSTDSTYANIKKLSRKNKNIHCFRLRGWFGKAVGLSVGFAKANGKIIFTMDGDLQDNPSEIPNFLKKLDEGYDLVSGWKKVRHDPITKTLPSRVINFTLRILTGLNLHDINCGFKAYRAEVVKDLNIYGDLYRFIPVLAQRKGFKIGEIVVKHRQRIFGKSKYGFKRFISGFLDLLTVFFLVRYLKRPGHFFGTFGIIFLSAGFVIGLYITYLRITTGGIAYRYPLLFFGVLPLWPPHRRRPC